MNAQGLVQTSISNSELPWTFGPTLYRNVGAIALQLLRAARIAAGEPLDGISFSEPEKVGAICKPAHTGAVTALHQDEGYYDPEFDYSCARVMVWLPLVDVDEQGGCMHFVSGSNARPERVLTHEPAPNQTMNPLTLLSFNELAVATGDEADSWERSTAVPLPAGGAAFWLPRTLHGSAANASATPRKALLMSASCEPTPLAVPFERPWRTGVRAGQTERQPGESLADFNIRTGAASETGLDPNGVSAGGASALVGSAWSGEAPGTSAAPRRHRL